MTGSALKAVVFDVNETLIDMTPVAKRMQANGLTKEAFQVSMVLGNWSHA